MKPNKIIIIVFTIIFCGSAQAANNFGAGIVLGDPTGLSFKYNFNSKNSIDGALSWSSSVDVHLHANYIWHKAKLFYLDHYPMDLFYGIGARLRDRNDDKFRNDDDADMQLGARAPVGLRFMFNDPRIEVFTELALIFNVIPETDADLDFGIGARYYF